MSNWLRRTLQPMVERAYMGKPEKLEKYLVNNGLASEGKPDYELASALADEVGAFASDTAVILWGLITGWASITAGEAPDGDRRSYLPFCAAQCLGVFAVRSEAWWVSALDRLRDLMTDPREMVRHGAMLGLRRMLAEDFLPVVNVVVKWIESDARFMEMAIAAEAVSEPRLLTDRSNAGAALALHWALIRTYLKVPVVWRDHEDSRALREVLKNSISVVVAAHPEEGFRAMQQWALLPDAVLKAILIENLLQARLSGVYHSYVDDLLRQLKHRS